MCTANKKQKSFVIIRKKHYLCNAKARKGAKGVVLEWLKRHAWKACSRQKRLASSNLAHSAQKNS